MPLLNKLFQKTEEGMLPNLFYGKSISMIPSQNNYFHKERKLHTNVIYNMYCSMNYNAKILKNIGKLNPETYKKGLYTMNK